MSESDDKQDDERREQLQEADDLLDRNLMNYREVRFWMLVVAAFYVGAVLHYSHAPVDAPTATAFVLTHLKGGVDFYSIAFVLVGMLLLIGKALNNNVLRVVHAVAGGFYALLAFASVAAFFSASPYLAVNLPYLVFFSWEHTRAGQSLPKVFKRKRSDK